MLNLQAIKQRFSIIGRSEALDRALSTAVRVSDTDLSVLITGESGVGKEVFSKIIHGLSIRKHSQFIAINCGAIPEGTINSELFGHEKGAFTGATSDRKGYFETVDGGTIFLDEIGEMPLDTQSFLLRILESGEFIRVGSSKVLKTNVRVVAATNVSLQEKIKAGKFREDLYYRLNTVPIYVPPLRERREDIYMLFRKFCVDFAEKYRTTPIQLEEQARQIIENYSWPGNIRQLRNTAEQLSVLSEDKLVTAEHLIFLIPNITERHLPMIPNKESNSNTMQEREILYKLLFDMKSDLNDLKSLVYELIRRNNLNIPDWRSLQQLQSGIPAPPNNNAALGAMANYPATNGDIKENVYKEDFFNAHEDNRKPVIIDDVADTYNELEVVDENLSIMEHEKSLIQKALRKYSGRRKDAAQELGISERTLYRKIKEYDL